MLAATFIQRVFGRKMSAVDVLDPERVQVATVERTELVTPFHINTLTFNLKQLRELLDPVLVFLAIVNR